MAYAAREGGHLPGLDVLLPALRRRVLVARAAALLGEDQRVGTAAAVPHVALEREKRKRAERERKRLAERQGGEGGGGGEGGAPAGGAGGSSGDGGAMRAKTDGSGWSAQGGNTPGKGPCCHVRGKASGGVHAQVAVETHVGRWQGHPCFEDMLDASLPEEMQPIGMCSQCISLLLTAMETMAAHSTAARA